MFEQGYNLSGNCDPGKPNHKHIHRSVFHRIQKTSGCTYPNIQRFNSNSQTSLSHFIWGLKRKNINFSITWKILDRGGTFSPVSGKCGLCIGEKFYILLRPESANINSRDEVFSACRHKKPKLLIKPKKKRPGWLSFESENKVDQRISLLISLQIWIIV